MKKGTILILILCAISTLLWIFAKFSPTGINTSVLRLLSQLSGILATTLLSINFVLASRFKFLDTFLGGLDKAYKLHHIVGGLAFIIALYHPILLAINALPNFRIALTYLVPFLDTNYIGGPLGLYSMIALIIFTFYVKLPYHLWKKVHSLMVLPLLFVTIHVIVITSDTSRFLPLKLWLIFLLSAGLVSYIYKRFLYKYLGPVYNYKVVEVNAHEGHTDILLSPESKKMDFVPGQFAYISFGSEGVTKEKHPYSMSSSPKEDTIRFSIKKLGDHTNTLGNLKSGDTATLYGPYGSFGEKSLIKKDKHQIWLAGGIGITPFLSLMHYHCETKSNTDIDFFYCAKTKDEAFYLQEVQELSLKCPNIKIHLFCEDIDGFINAEKVKTIAKGIDDAVIFICGPKPMMVNLQKQFEGQNVKKYNLIFEDFSFI